MSDPKTPSGRSIWEVSNQLGGYIGPSTPDDLMHFLNRESEAAAELAQMIVDLQEALDLKQVIADESIKWTRERIQEAIKSPAKMMRYILDHRIKNQRRELAEKNQKVREQQESLRQLGLKLKALQK